VRVRIAVVVAVAALGLAGAAVALGSSSATPTLKGTVGPGFTISLKNSKGQKVKTLKAGTYKFAITDKADIHTFDVKQLSGGKFHKEITTDTFVGKKTVTITLKKGKWRYYCAVHPTEMFGNFTVN
jgi:plastocyanin